MFLDKLLSTNITLVWLLFSMYLQVRGKLSSLCKLLSTNITLEWLLFFIITILNTFRAFCCYSSTMSDYAVIAQ